MTFWVIKKAPEEEPLKPCIRCETPYQVGAATIDYSGTGNPLSRINASIPASRPRNAL